MKNKLMPLYGRAIACLVLMCLFLAQACRKDASYPNQPLTNSERQLIKQEAIQKWLRDNPVSQVLSLDWKNARQTKIMGQNVVRIPTLNIDKIAVLNQDNGLMLNGLSSGLSSRGGGKISSTGGQITGGNPNYNEEHPPEVFVVQEANTAKIHAFLLNFVPTDRTKEVGKGGIWSGKLYEWNLTGDTLLVQEVEQSKLKTRYGLKLNAQDLQSALLKNGSDNKLSSLNDKKTSGKWADFWRSVGEALGEFIGWVGSLFGVSTYDIWDERWRLDVIDWNGIGTFFGKIFEGDGVTSGTTGSGDPIYMTYMPGYLPPNDGGLGDPNWEPYPGGGTGPSAPTYSSSASFLITKLSLTLEQQDFLFEHEDEIAPALHSYYIANIIDTQTIPFLEWAVAYLTANTNITFDVFEKQFLGTPEKEEFNDYDSAYWNDPNLVIAVQNLPSFAAFSLAYPKTAFGTFEMDAASVFNLVGGTPKALRDATLADATTINDNYYSNACALRVSRALNYSGVTIPEVSGTYKGSDNKNYFLSAASLNAWMMKAFPPTTSNSIRLTSSDAGTNGSGFANAINGYKGIYILIPNYPGANYFGASGHAGLHTYPPVTHYYFTAKGGVSKITLWILN